VYGKGEQGHDTRVTGWYRCSCGKAFSNEVEIDPPDLYDDGAMRYYLEGGAVFCPAMGDPVAQCWECGEGEATDYPSLGEWERQHLEPWERQGYERE